MPIPDPRALAIFIGTLSTVLGVAVASAAPPSREGAQDVVALRRVSGDALVPFQERCQAVGRLAATGDPSAGSLIHAQLGGPYTCEVARLLVAIRDPQGARALLAYLDSALTRDDDWLPLRRDGPTLIACIQALGQLGDRLALARLTLLARDRQADAGTVSSDELFRNDPVFAATIITITRLGDGTGLALLTGADAALLSPVLQAPGAPERTAAIQALSGIDSPGLPLALGIIARLYPDAAVQIVDVLIERSHPQTTTRSVTPPPGTFTGVAADAEPPVQANGATPLEDFDE